MHLITRPWRRYADFQGRSGRREFWLFLALATMVIVGANMLDGLDGERTVIGAGMGMIELVCFLLLLVPTLAVGVRRLHDSARSGWWMMLIYIPYAATLALEARPGLRLPVAGALLFGGIAWLILMALPGTAGSNAYGNRPD